MPDSIASSPETPFRVQKAAYMRWHAGRKGTWFGAVLPFWKSLCLSALREFEDAP